MPVRKGCQNFFRDALAPFHKYRQNALMDATMALINGASLTLTSIGRFLPGSAQVKNKIKSAWEAGISSCSPATPPGMRVRTGRFESLRLHESGQTLFVEPRQIQYMVEKLVTVSPPTLVA
jgi:hypothetical protein